MASVAALGAMSTVAMAQSSMTIYGNLDQSLFNLAQNGQTATTTGSNIHSSSYWGITSTEDLGGGLKASFDLRSEITLLTGQAASATTSPNTGAWSTTGTTNTTGTLATALSNANTAPSKPDFWNRNAYVQLESSSWGAVKVGRQANVWWEAQGTLNTTPGSSSFGFGNLTSMQGNSTNLISQTTGGVAGANPAAAASSANPASLQFMGSTSSNPGYYGESNAYMGGLSYSTPTINGFKAQYQVGMIKTTYTTAGNVNNTWNAAAYYDAGPLHVATGTSVINDATGANQIQQTVLGATYKFGQWQAIAAINKQKFGGQAVLYTGSAVDNNTAQAVGVNYNFSSALNVAASYGTLTDDVNSNNKVTQVGVIANYMMSPRTSTYFGVGTAKNSGGMMQVPLYGAAGLAPTATNVTATGILTGIKHTF